MYDPFLDDLTIINSLSKEARKLREKVDKVEISLQVMPQGEDYKLLLEQYNGMLDYLDSLRQRIIFYQKRYLEKVSK